jgi:hypothetical protein
MLELGEELDRGPTYLEGICFVKTQPHIYEPSGTLRAKYSFGENLKLTCTFPYFLPTDS